MRYDVSFRIEVDNNQQAVSLRDRAKDWFERQGVAVSGWNTSRADPSWRVTGATLKGGTIVPIAETVEASDKKAAQDQVLSNAGTATAAVFSVVQASHGR